LQFLEQKGLHGLAFISTALLQTGHLAFMIKF